MILTEQPMLIITISNAGMPTIRTKHPMFAKRWEKSKTNNLKQEPFELFRIEPMLDKKIILLSSGELRKFQLTKTLLTAPRVLIMDNPFIGLDAPTRELLFSLLDRLTKMSSVQIILVLSMLDDIPSFITHVIPVDKMTVYPKMERDAYLEAFSFRRYSGFF